MEKIQKQRVSYYDVYVANDGTEFNSEDECKKYDKSAEGVLNAMLSKMVVKEATEEDIFSFGGSDNPVQVLAPTGDDDKKIILQLYLLKNPHLNKEDHYHYVESASNLIDRAVKENDCLFIGRGYDRDSFWLYGTRHSMQEELDKFCETEKKDD